MVPITLMKAGDRVVVKKVSGSDAVRQHLAEMGFVAGAEIHVINAIGGDLILQVHESRIALNKDMAKRIMV